MNDFIWQNRTKVYFGENAVDKHLANLIKEYATKESGKVLLGYGGGSIKKNGAFDDAVRAIEKAGYEVLEFGGIMSNPTVDKMLEGVKLARENDIALILAVGGGSAMDCCKAISVQLQYDGDAWQDFWIDGKEMPFETFPCGVVVTMPATGSEVNPCAVLTNTETHIKCDRGYPQINPRFAIMDPRYTLTMPMRQIKAGSFDILSHIMEGYFSYPLEENATDDVANGLMYGLIRDIRAALRDPQNLAARANIMWHASLAENNIIKMGKTKDFQCHNMEHQLSAYTNCNHGEGLAVLHPAYYRHIYKDGLAKFCEFAREVWRLKPEDYASDDELALAGIQALDDFITEAGLPKTLRELGITDRDSLREIADSCFINTGGFRALTHDEINEIYNEAF